MTVDGKLENPHQSIFFPNCQPNEFAFPPDYLLLFLPTRSPLFSLFLLPLLLFIFFPGLVVQSSFVPHPVPRSMPPHSYEPGDVVGIVPGHASSHQLMAPLSPLPPITGKLAEGIPSPTFRPPPPPASRLLHLSGGILGRLEVLPTVLFETHPSPRGWGGGGVLSTVKGESGPL